MKFYKILLLASIICSCTFRGDSTKLKEAEDLIKKEKYDEAIAKYEEHIKYRKELSSKPEIENPNFYRLIIGDLYLKKNAPEDAYKNYRQAEETSVDKLLVADRYRALSRWYEERSELLKAEDILKKHRELDPLLFDSMLDTLSRKILSN